MDKETYLDKVAGCLMGLSVGDAMGRPADGLSPYEVILRYQRIDGFYGCPDGTAATPSGVSEAAILMAGSIIRGGGLDETQVSKTFSATGRHKYGVGMAAAISALKAGKPLHECGTDAGDGEFLPRMAVIGLLAAVRDVSDVDFISQCKTACSFSHKSKMAMLSGYLLAAMIKSLAKSSETLLTPCDMYDDQTSLLGMIIHNCLRIETGMGVEDGDSLWKRLQFVRSKLRTNAKPVEVAGVLGNGNSFKEALPFSIFCFMNSPDNFKSVETAASLGGASSVNSSIVGAMLGACGGLGIVPEGMRDGLEGGGRVLAVSRKFTEGLMPKDV